MRKSTKSPKVTSFFKWARTGKQKRWQEEREGQQKKTEREDNESNYNEKGDTEERQRRRSYKRIRKCVWWLMKATFWRFSPSALLLLIVIP